MLAAISALLAAALLAAAPVSAETDFITFETGLVRPLALSPDGTRLFAVNTPDGRLEIFDVGQNGLTWVESVRVGLEPCALAARTDTEVWVVNHLSDSVSVVDVGSAPARVIRTLLVGDEPRDIVFAGPGRSRAFITTAHRGQHRTHPSLVGVPGAGDPQLTTPGIGRADVWVYDASAPGVAIGGRPLAILSLFGDTPRALAVSPDGATVYVAVFQSGNQTTTLPEGVVCNGFGPDPCVLGGVIYPGGNPGPPTNHAGDPAPETGLIVKFDPASGEWRDELGRDWSAAVRFDLPDRDVFAIDATTLDAGGASAFAHVGTVLFNMAVNPVSGKVYVSNAESINAVRFEGPGVFGGSTVQGHLAEYRITVLEHPDAVRPRHLNKHLDYGTLASLPDGSPNPAFNKSQKQSSLATPLEMVVSQDGRWLYVAAFGSAKIGVFSTAALEDDRFDPVSASTAHIPVGGGPAGLVLDEARGRLYVLTRFDNSVSVVDLSSRAVVQSRPLFNPEPPHVVEGRPFLYDAAQTSANGEASCSSCHIFGDLDALAWDLGNPDDSSSSNPMPPTLPLPPPSFHPMKGPMTTQTLRGLVNHGAMHWRGDRSNGFFGIDATDSDLSFRNFVVAFQGLVGREALLDPADMQRFSDFALELTLPPNPVRALDGSLNAAQQAGRDFFMGPRLSDGVSIVPGLSGFTCNGCHTLDPANGFFGTDGRTSFENEPQNMKVAHLRNLYTKTGMFGMAQVSFSTPGDHSHQGPQIRGFGFLHDGSIDTLFRFFSATVFQNNGDVGFDGGDPQRRDMVEFMLAFDSDLAPIVGQQVTLSRDEPPDSDVSQRIDLLIQRASTPFASKILGAGATECDLVAAATLDGRVVGFQRLASGLFRPDDGGPDVSDAELRAVAAVPGQQVTYTCAPPGSGARLGVDRDRDGALDGRDLCPATPDPAQLDADGDGRGDLCDNCRLRANADQADHGAVSPATLADGIGDACQCGDGSDDGKVDVLDWVLLERHVKLGAPLPSLDKGSVDLAAVRVALTGAAPLPQTCPAATL
ncbi:MAG: hypothetical protein ACE5FG_02280 [Myxococcota bacterium]